ncbi:hypothetical protein [Streptosporangium minutum]|uniref:hypothetical protein n=1 Tax=Streptosporangium minutum TaxID=569862 RepID=UPI0013FD554E|nr:hypothetical protein [Streptosporangium minutum]
MIAFIVVIEAALALTGLMALCRLTRYTARRPLYLHDRRDHHDHLAGVRRRR